MAELTSRRCVGLAAAIALMGTALSGPGASALTAGPEAWTRGHHAAICRADPDPPAYYAVELVTTKNIPGTGYSRGTADVTYATSPFGVSIAADGSYRYDLRLTFQRLPPPREGVYVGWVTTTEVDQVQRLGTPDADGSITGQVAWNKFLVVVTLEAEDDPDAETWSGPIVMRGMSRSGMMHTMVGHGPFQEENCAAYGYAN